MKRFIGTISRRNNDSPEAVAVRAVNGFCECTSTDEEYIHLPPLVEAAESSPQAARQAAAAIMKLLSKPASAHPQRQYNAVMLVRILSEHPGPSFTRHIDARFVAVVKVLLRDGRDVNVAQILRETLETLARTRAEDANLTALIEMWTKEKQKFQQTYGYPPFQSPPPANQMQQTSRNQDYFSRQHRLKGLPPPGELAARIHEANESAKLLMQMLTSTPTSEFFENDMLAEFAARCQSASRSVQGYIAATDPAPDEDTMLTLIETHDKIAVALSRYHRATLGARRATTSTTNLATGGVIADPATTTARSNTIDVAATATPATADGDDKKAGKRYIPRLSMPRIPKLSKDKSPAVPTETKPTLYTPKPHNTDAPTDTNPTITVADADRPTTPINRQPEIHAVSPPDHRDRVETSHEALPTWEYNPNEFQVENPFADKFATSSRPSMDHSNRVSTIEDHRVSTIDTDHGPGTESQRKSMFETSEALAPAART